MAILSRGLWLTLLLGLVGCGWLDDAPQTEDPVALARPAPRWEQGLPYAVALTAARPLPGWVQAPLPRQLSAYTQPWAGERLPDRSAVVDQLCLDQAGRREDFDQALRQLLAAGEPEDQVVRKFRGLLLCTRPEPCAWLRQGTEIEAPAAVREVYWQGLAACGQAQDAERFAAASTPDDAVVRWFERRANLAGPHYHPRLQRAVERIFEGEQRGDVWRALRVLGQVDHPRAAAALLQLYGRTAAEHKTAVALLLGPQSDPAVRRLYRDACDDDTPACLDPVRPPLDDLGSWLRRPGVAPLELLVEHPDHRTALTDALRGCVVTAPIGTASSCLRSLARLDADAALRVAPRELPIDDTDPAGLIAHTLDAWQVAGSLDAHLIDLGLIDAPAEGVTVVDKLVSAQRAVWSVGYDGWHDGPLRRLGLALGLQDAVFKQVPPSEQGDDLLFAWNRGWRWRLLARHDPSTIDGEQVAGLLNLVAAEAGVELRVLPVREGYRQALVIGSPAALSALRDEGLLVSASE